MITGTPGPTPRRHGYFPPTYTITPTPSRTPTLIPERSTCLGDRNGDARVAIDELVVAVGVALETLPLSAFPALDFDQSQQVEIDELMIAVNNALSDCPADLVVSGVRPYPPDASACEVYEVQFCVVNHGGDAWREFSALIRGEIFQVDFRFVPGLAAQQEACTTFIAGDIGPAIIGGSELPEFTVEVDNFGEVAESNEDNNVQTVVISPAAVCTPTPTPSGVLEIRPATLSILCEGDFNMTLTNISTDEPLIINSIGFHHGYSQGFYSTGFTVLNADEDSGHGQDQVIRGPIVLPSGDSFLVPIHYEAGLNFSRLHVTSDTSARNIQDQVIYYGYGCPTPTPNVP
jgi:hypothetical protein